MPQILIVEDNEDNRELMAYLLRAFGYDVRTARDGGEGIDALEQLRPDLIICDVHMPKVDGLGVARAVKQRTELAGVPIVAVTALAMAGDEERLLAAGFDGYVSKPIEPQQLVGEVERFLAAGHAPAQTVAAYAPATGGSASAEPTIARASARILVVDDIEENRELTRAVLEPIGYEVTAVDGASGALEAMRAQKFALILSDLRMPERDGLDLLRSVKRDPDGRSIPFVVITASKWTDEERRRAFELGAVAFLTRPIEPHDLLKELALRIEETES